MLRITDHELIWFFRTPDGTLFYSFALNSTVARIRLRKIGITSPLKLVPSPVEAGQLANDLGV